MSMRTLLAIYLLALITVTALADAGCYGSLLLAVHSAPLGDKFLHAGFAGILALLTSLAILSRYPARPLRQIVIGCVLVAAACTVEEATNLLTPHRGFELLDLAANYLGIAFFGFVLPALNLLRQRRMILADAR